MTRVGILGSLEVTNVALERGADYVEPTIVGNLALFDEEGVPRLNPAFEGQRFPSFAILVPATLRVSDPAVPIDDIRRYFSGVLAVVGAAAEPGARIVFGSGASRRIPDGVESEAAERRFAESLVIARDAAAEQGLHIMLEPLNRQESNLINSIGEAVEFLDRHGVDGVTVVADYYHLDLENEPLSAVTDNISRIGHAHLADSDRRWLGFGDGGWREFIRVLREAGYAGDISVECRWSADELDAEVSASIEALREAATE